MKMTSLICFVVSLAFAPHAGAASLEEIDAKAGWVNQPVKTVPQVEEEIRKLTAGAPPADLNDYSLEGTAKIIQSLGRPPAEGEAVDTEAELKIQITHRITSLNPIFPGTTEQLRIHGLISGSLIGADHVGNIIGNGELVSSWQTSADHMMAKFVLRPGVTWSDGAPFQ
ncbi:hypothetical protein K2X33_04785, partial [bacterium]|nr:hypothetical protein [bacterium]